MKRAKKHWATRGAGTLVQHRGIWHARWKVNGKLVTRSTGTSDLSEARDILARMAVPRTGIRDREAMQKISIAMSANLADEDIKLKTIGIPVGSLFTLYLESPSRSQVSPGTLKSYQGELSMLTQWINKNHPEITSARDISQTVADEYIEYRSQTASTNTVNKDLNLFAIVWRTLARKYGLEYNPWSPEHIARKRQITTSRRALTEQEVKAILAVATGEMHLLIALGINTGLRMSDILNLTWDKIDFPRRILSIPRTQKTGAPICLPILPDLLAELKAQRKQVDDVYVLPQLRSRRRADGNPNAICRSVSVVFRDAGIETQQPGTVKGGSNAPLATFHSLRHTFVTRLITRGVNPAIVREAVGHSTMLMTEHYTHISADDLQKALGQ